MARAQVDKDIADRLGDLHRNPEAPVAYADIQTVVETIMTTMSGDLSAKDLQLYSELEDLATYIESAKQEIAALRPDEVTDTYLPTATDELDAIVEATAEATFSIMDATEVVEGVMEKVDPELSNQLMEATTRIYEACGFQDITGQRINKVVKTLKHIEEKIEALVSAFGEEIAHVKEAQKEMGLEEQKNVEPTKPTDEDLLQGPQLAGQANSQADIDALLASFD
ncbi:MAG: protein phosphatase CheZ [Rhodospirillales bacterium]